MAMAARQEGLILVGILLIGSLIIQVQMKLFANEIAPLLARSDVTLPGRIGLLAQAAFSWRGIFICVLGAALVAVWLGALTRMELSVALPLASIALVVNALLGGLLLGEALSLMRVAGIVAVAVGLGLVLRT
jgi:multidrug transporter EmrE-like cation transporter